MAWFAANWFWVLIFIAFVAMHLFGHGGHSGHGGGSRQATKGEGDEPQGDAAATSSSASHRH